MKYCIYRITNLVNGKTYIGQHMYKVLDDKYMGSGTLIKRAIKKYGINSFKKEILVFNVSCKSQIDLLEKVFIESERKKVGTRNCYNIAKGGGGGGPWTEEHRKYMSELFSRRTFSEEHKKKLRGRTFSDEHKKKISEKAKLRPSNRKGVKLSDETKKKISEANKGKHSSHSSHSSLTELTKQRMRAAALKRWERYRNEQQSN